MKNLQLVTAISVRFVVIPSRPCTGCCYLLKLRTQVRLSLVQLMLRYLYQRPVPRSQSLGHLLEMLTCLEISFDWRSNLLGNTKGSWFCQYCHCLLGWARCGNDDAGSSNNPHLRKRRFFTAESAKHYLLLSASDHDPVSDGEFSRFLPDGFWSKSLPNQLVLWW